MSNIIGRQFGGMGSFLQARSSALIQQSRTHESNPRWNCPARFHAKPSTLST